MRKLSLGILAAIALGLLAGASTFKNVPFAAPKPQEPDVTQSATITTALGKDMAIVARVIDGDTVELADGEHLRYIGMDAPETVNPKKPIQCFGPESSARNKELIEGKVVRLEKDVEDKDKYGRLLRYVWLGGTMIDLELVKEGYARAYPYPPDTKYAKEFAAAEASAKVVRLGLWRACK